MSRASTSSSPSRFAAPGIPAQRPAAPVSPGSLTQRSARTGRTCETCGDPRITEIAMTLTDGTPVAFTSCHHCETKSWRRLEPETQVDITFDTVLDHTRKPR
jgi:hypothetical protein